jgi:hypothetical protein
MASLLLQHQIFPETIDTSRQLQFVRLSGFNNLSTVPAGSLSNAALFGAKTVKVHHRFKPN